jgi:hypothetical protein
MAKTTDGRLFVSSYGAGDVFVTTSDLTLATKVWHLDGEVEDLTTDGTSVFAAWFSAGKIVKFTEVASSDSEVIVVGGHPAGLVLDGSTFFFTDQSSGTVASVPRQGGGRTDLARVPNSTAIAIAVDSTHVYWVAGKWILRIHR